MTDTEPIPQYSQAYMQDIRELGEGKILFNRIDELQHTESISPQLAEAMRKTLSAKGQYDVGSLNQLAIFKMYSLYTVLTDIEGMLQSAMQAMHEHEDGDFTQMWTEWQDLIYDPSEDL